MKKYWYLCGDTGIIKYAGEFNSFDDCSDSLDNMRAMVIWIFCGKPQVEKQK